MKKSLAYLLPLLLVVGIAGGIFLKLKRNKAIAEQRVFHHDPAETIARNDIALAQMETAGASPLVFSGTFEPYRETKISPEVQGRITRIPVDAGDWVAKGQALVQLDDVLLQLQLQSAEVQLEGLSADVARFAILAEADAIQGVQLEKARLALQSARIQRATILEQIERTIIRAPFPGIVWAKLNEEGGFAAPGVPLIHLLDIGQLRFTILVPENDLRHFHIGGSHEIQSDAFPDQRITGKVSMIAGKANAGHSFPVQLTVKNLPDNPLRAGMFGKMELSVENQAQ